MFYRSENRDTTPRLDPLRGRNLAPPLYGVEADQSIYTTPVTDDLQRVELLAKAREREQEVLAMYALLNATAPINRLPVELLVDIFSLVQESNGVKQWLDTLRVCRHWFVVSSTAATLWRCLLVGRCTNLLRTGLARSCAATIGFTTYNSHASAFLESVSIISPHTHRIHSLSIGEIREQAVPALLTLVQSEMPSLRSLYAHMDYDQPEVILDLQPSCLPCLEELDVGGFNVFGNSSIMPQLRRINIIDCGRPRGDSQVRTAQLVDAMRSMKNVSELRMRKVHASDMDSFAGLAGAVGLVELEKMWEVKLMLDAPLMKHMLSGVILPPTATVHLKLPFYSKADLCEVLPDDRRTLPILDQIVQVCIGASEPDDHVFQAYTEVHSKLTSNVTIPLKLSVQTVDFPGPDARRDTIEDFFQIFHDSPLQSIVLGIMPDVYLYEDWSGIFASFPALHHLDLVAYSEEDCAIQADHFISVLDPENYDSAEMAELKEDGDTEVARAPLLGAVPCPALRSLHLTGPQAAPDNALLETAVACLENRRRALGVPSGEHVLQTLMLNLQHSDEEQYKVAKTTFEARLASLVDVVDYRDTRNTSFDD
ncbi:hypothetical protein C8Q77DRAFT_131002 [Trametes polyzona]|nr:hypothetical protein C8Q77DRAFT_131002 [Trametes polyzona]